MIKRNKNAKYFQKMKRMEEIERREGEEGKRGRLEGRGRNQRIFILCSTHRGKGDTFTDVQ